MKKIKELSQESFLKLFFLFVSLCFVAAAFFMPDRSDMFSDLWDIIRSLKGKVTIILTTHYMEEAEALSDRVAIMKDGKLLLCDTAENIKAIADTDNFEQAFIRIVKGVAE